MKIYTSIIKRLFKEQSGNIVTSEVLLLMIGGVVLSGIVLKSLMTPLATLHRSSVENITKVSRGF